jgi:N-methylhydantoinase A
MIVATDVGGTFTDYVLFSDGKLQAFKALTTKPPSRGIIEQLGNSQISEFSHGTTVAVNAILERKGEHVTFFTTKGFKDLVHIGRQARTNVYSFKCDRPKIPVGQIVEINERMGQDGMVITPLSTDDLELNAQESSKHGKTAVIGLINSYSNPENEITAKEILTKYYKTVITSHDIRREIREYDRFSTAIMEGYTLPIVQNYLKALKPLSNQFYIMQSNGGKTNPENIRAVNMIMSGPAGGVAATQALCARLKIDNAIAYDMGGTSVDVSAILNGVPVYTDIMTISDIPIKTLAIDIESIGAGGGSIAWVDDGGALKVGPQSAGSNPGPACYNQGGNEFTVSDANLILGVLGGKISELELNGGKAIEAGKQLCHLLNMDIMELCQGVIRIVNNNMVSALKRISIGKGYDPRNFTLVSFGGAGPMHCCAIANIVGIKKIVIPPFAGAFSALGILSAPVRFDYIRTILIPVDEALQMIPEVVQEFKSDLHKKLGDKYPDPFSQVSMDIRYIGQGHEINIELGDNVVSAFHNRHEQLFGYKMPDNPIEVVNVKMVGEVPGKDMPISKYKKGEPQIKDKRDVYPEKNVSVYNKDFFGGIVEGPCIIEENTTTVFVASDWTAELDEFGILHLEYGV